MTKPNNIADSRQKLAFFQPLEKGLFAVLFLIAMSLGLAPVAQAKTHTKAQAKTKAQSKSKSQAKSKSHKQKETVATKKAGGKKILVVQRGRHGKIIAVRTTSTQSKFANKEAVRRVVMVRGKRRVITTWVPVHVAAPVAVVEPARPSMAQALGLRGMHDALDLKSSVALVVDQNTNEVLYEKNTHAVLPIASITKLMTAVVVMDSRLPLHEMIQITDEDRDYEKGTRSRLQPGMQFSREELLRLALMSSENRAASALGRSYPGGRAAFVEAMNRKAQELGMRDSHYVDSNGLSSKNVSSASDLTRMVNSAYRYPLIREFTTTNDAMVEASGHPLKFVNTNRLVRSGSWDIGLQKTGFINEAGRCLVMQAKIQGRAVVMVFLDSVGKLTRFADAARVRNWLESADARPAAVRAPVASLNGQRPI